MEIEENQNLRDYSQAHNRLSPQKMIVKSNKKKLGVCNCM